MSALCLGLGGKESAFNRAVGIPKYIRVGCESAVIEIELRNLPGNYIVRRTIRRDVDSSLWELNGQEVQKLQIRSLMTELNIKFELENPLHFLPENEETEYFFGDRMSLLDMTLGYLDTTGGIVEKKEKIKALEVEFRTLAGADDLSEEEMQLKTVELESAEASFVAEVGPHIELLSSKFQELMHSIGKEGEVWLEKGLDEEGFLKFTIEIKVTFRQDRPQIVKNRRRFHFASSETSFIGIFYFLAVHECGVCPPPFRLLDGFAPVNDENGPETEAKIVEILDSLESPQLFINLLKKDEGPLVRNYEDDYDNVKVHVLPDRMEEEGQ